MNATELASLLKNINNDSWGSPSVIVSFVALVISIIALIGTVAQVLQQYYASAVGYSNCDERVIDLWAESTSRSFRLKEVRFEVLFEAPVLFLAPPTNRNRPIRDAPLFYLKGTSESHKEVRIRDDEEVMPASAMAKRQLSFRELIHTADNERVTWLTLLAALQRMERQSFNWQKDQYDIEPKFHPFWHNRTLSVALQRKRRSWDTMPTDVKAPYLTTTMCHLIETAAILGMYWKEFDQTRDRFRAEGNGFTMTATVITDLGLMFSFLRIGETRFHENRVVPVNEVKELCFGYVPTIFREETVLAGGLKYPIDTEKDPDTPHTLYLGSAREVGETFAVLGCNINTRNLMIDKTKTHAHIFPIIFELIGMLAPPFHIENTSFRMLPNPSEYRWDSRAFRLRRLFTAFKHCLLSSQTDPSSRSPPISEILHSITLIDAAYATHDAESTFPGQLYKVLDTLHLALRTTTTALLTAFPPDTLHHVLRAHFDTVAAELNRKPHSVFDDLNAASALDKEALLMSVYFGTIKSAVETLTLKSSSSSSRATATANKDEEEADSDDKDERSERKIVADLWVAFVFRMLCWLMLHTFHRNDVQIPKSGLLGSRMPVFVS